MREGEGDERSEERGRERWERRDGELRREEVVRSDCSAWPFV